MLRNYHSCLLTLPCLNVLLVSICHILLHRDNGKVWGFFLFFSCLPVLSYICLYQIWLSLQTSMKKTNINTTISIQILKDALLFICPCIFFVYTICFSHDRSRSLPTFRLCLWFYITSMSIT